LISAADIFSTLGDEKSLSLFRAIATKCGTTEDFSVQLRLSHKEYYTRMSKFLKIGMVKRKNAKYFLTAFGQLVYDAEEMVRKSVDSLWKLKALDSIDFSDEITPIERKKLLESLLDDLDIRHILSKAFLKPR
jgi:predicted transcriptional regulator